MIAFANVDIGGGGLPCCPACRTQRARASRSRGEIITDVTKVVAGWGGGPGPNVSLGGGDAFLHPELPTVVSQVLAAGVERLRLVSAGPALAEASNAPGVVDAGVRQVEFAVLSVDQGPKVGAAPFARVLDGVHALLDVAASRSATVVAVARVAICPHTMRSTSHTVAALAAAGVAVVTIEFLEEAVPSHDWFDCVVDSGVTNRAWVQFEHVGADTSKNAYRPLHGVDLSSARAWADVQVTA